MFNMHRKVASHIKRKVDIYPPLSYTTWNPSDKGAGITLSNGNLTAFSNTYTYRSVRGVLGRTSGKYYCEMTYDSTATSKQYIGLGIANASKDLTLGLISAYSRFFDTWFGRAYGASSWIAYGDDSNYPKCDTGDIVSMAVDLDNHKIWWGKNGVWFISGNPATGANPAFTDLNLISGNIYPCWMGILVPTSSGGNQGSIKFGPPFTYTKPSGFTGWGA